MSYSFGIPVSVSAFSSNGKFRSTGEPSIIIAYMSGCIHCKHLLPVISDLKKFCPGIVVYQINQNSASDAFWQKLEVQGFPTIFSVRADGTLVKYPGSRDWQSICRFVKTNCK